jgi:hypothetical protein
MINKLWILIYKYKDKNYDAKAWIKNKGSNKSLELEIKHNDQVILDLIELVNN